MRFFLTLLTLGVMFFNVAFAVTRVWDWRASKYPATMGVVLGTRIDQRSMGTHSGSGGDYYQGIICYRYTVDGHVYESKHMAYTDDLVSRESAQRFIDRYKVGQPIRVYYNPHNPVDAVLFPNMWDDAVGFLSILNSRP